MPKGPISSITQAKEEMSRLVSFMKHAADLSEQAANLNKSILESTEALQNYLGILDGVLGAGMGAQSKAAKTATPLSSVKIPVSRFRSVMAPDAPASVHERVLTIMKDLGKPVLPKEIALQYMKRNWPLPKTGSGTIYNLISGTVAYLYNRKGVLIKGQTGYTLKPHKDLSELINAPQLPPSPEERAKRHAAYLAGRERKRAEKKAAQAAANPTLPFVEPQAQASGQ